jgi:zinc transporter ZupT
LTAGGFLYMCLSNIFPDIRESFRETKGNLSHFIFTMAFIVAGIGIMFAVTFIE